VSTVPSVRPSQHVQQPGSEADTSEYLRENRSAQAPTRPTGLVFTLLFVIIYFI
jgi:hypothetical protein